MKQKYQPFYNLIEYMEKENKKFKIFCNNINKGILKIKEDKI